MTDSNHTSHAGSAGALACAAILALSGSALAHPPDLPEPCVEDDIEASAEAAEPAVEDEAAAAESEASEAADADVPTPVAEPDAAAPPPCVPAKRSKRPAAKHEPPPEYDLPPIIKISGPPPGYGAPPPPGYGSLDGAGPDQVRTERFSTGLMVTGIVFIPVGALALGAGGFLVFGKDKLHDRHDDVRFEHWGPEDPADAKELGVGLMIGGGAALVSGIIMTAVGARKIAVVESEEASIKPTVSVTAGGGNLTWSF